MNEHRPPQVAEDRLRDPAGERRPPVGDHRAEGEGDEHAADPQGQQVELARAQDVVEQDLRAEGNRHVEGEVVGHQGEDGDHPQPVRPQQDQGAAEHVAPRGEPARPGRQRRQPLGLQRLERSPESRAGRRRDVGGQGTAHEPRQGGAAGRSLEKEQERQVGRVDDFDQPRVLRLEQPRRLLATHVALVRDAVLVLPIRRAALLEGDQPGQGVQQPAGAGRHGAGRRAHQQL